MCVRSVRKKEYDMTYVYKCITCGQDFYYSFKDYLMGIYLLIIACPACGEENAPIKKCSTNNMTNTNDDNYGIE